VTCRRDVNYGKRREQWACAEEKSGSTNSRRWRENRIEAAHRWHAHGSDVMKGGSGIKISNNQKAAHRGVAATNRENRSIYYAI